MIKNRINLVVTAILGGALLVPTLASATNGMFLIGPGNKSRAMGGVGISNPLDSLSASSNPASIAGMEDRLDVGMDVFKPSVESQLGSISVESEAAVNGIGLESTFFMPAMAITYQWDDSYTLGFTMSAAGGGGTKFTTNFFEAANQGNATAPSVNSRLAIDLAIMEMAPTVAFKMDKTHSFGASLVIGVARFEAAGLGLFSTFTPSNSTANMTNQGKDWTAGAGVRLGWLGDFGDFNLGVVYTSRIYMDEFNHYTELFAEQGDLDVPARFGVGFSYKAKPDLLVAVDVTHTFYEDVAAIGNVGPNLAGDPNGPTENGTRELGLDTGMGFGWSNQTVIKLGAEYKYQSDITLRAGWNYGKSPINENREIIFNLLAPATVQHHLTMGGTYRLDKEMELNFSFVHAFEYEQSGPTYISDDGSNFGRAKMSQNSIGGSFSYRY